jgi:hypothetical protein
MDQKLNRRVAAIACVVSPLLVATDLWDNRDAFDSDGISYLDLADAWSRGDWHAALVGHWSPFYSWLLAVVIALFKPSPQWEFTAVHALNFFIFLLALASFSVLMREFLRAKNGIAEKLPDWSWLILGYSLFTWSVIRLIPPHLAVPDLIVCAVVYLVFAILLCIRNGVLGWKQAIAFGVLLAVGYLAKAVMFPMAFVFIGVALILAGNGTKRQIKVLASLVVFLSLSLPYVLALSRANERWMFSDAGRLNYAWYVNGVKRWNHWQGEEGTNGKPIHPTRKIYDDPAMYEFGTPFKVTYAPWYDPSYWYEGVRLKLDLRKQLSVIARNTKAFLLFLTTCPGPALPNQLTFYSLDSGDKTVGCLLAFFCGMLLTNLRRAAGVGRVLWFVFVPLAAALAAYGMLFFEGRYIAPYVTVLWLILYRVAAIPWSDESKKLFTALLTTAGAITLITTCAGTGRVVFNSARYFAGGKAETPFFQSGYTNWKVATFLQSEGLRAGDPVGAVGWAYSSYWARMDRLRIIAEIPAESATEFWSSDVAKREHVMQLFRDAGVTAVIAKVGYNTDQQQHLSDLHGLPGQVAALPSAAADWIASNGSEPGYWKRIKDTDFYVYLFQPAE